MEKRALCVYGLYQDYPVNSAPCKVYLDAPFSFEIQLKPRYFNHVQDVYTYSVDEFKGRMMMNDSILKRAIDNGQPYWVTADFDDPASCFDVLRRNHYAQNVRMVELPVVCTGWMYDVKKENVWIFKKNNDECKKVFDGDTQDCLIELEKQRKQRARLNEEYNARKKEYIDEVVKIAKDMCRSSDECAFLLNDCDRREWAFGKVDVAQIKAMEVLGYEI